MGGGGGGGNVMVNVALSHLLIRFSNKCTCPMCLHYYNVCGQDYSIKSMLD